jgi:Domain of unknown function (DUF4286)
MPIYEVSLNINNDIYDEYYLWLKDHIKEILQFNGFTHAEILHEKLLPDENKVKKITVRYFIQTERDLDDYLQHHAPRLRADAINKFGNQFNASRKIFLQCQLVTP